MLWWDDRLPAGNEIAVAPKKDDNLLGFCQGITYNLDASPKVKVSVQCRQCLERLIYQAAEIATSHPQLRAEASQAGLAILERTFSYDKTAPEIATECHRAIKKFTGNHDPYRKMKTEEIRTAERLFTEIRPKYGDDLDSCVRLATLGNTIDFFKNPAAVAEQMKRPVDFGVDHMDEFEDKLTKAQKILYLADNAGECFFDLPLLRKMREMTQVIYVVKGFPVQNDITLEELAEAGLETAMAPVIGTGSDAVGIDLSSCSPQFKHEFETADLVFAKGMGHYETLSELPVDGKIVHCLMAKCQPIADSLSVPLDSYIIMLR